MNLQSFIIIDEKGIDITSMNQEEVVPCDSKKQQLVLHSYLILIQTFFVYNDNLKYESEVRKVFDDKYSNEADLKNISKLKLE